MIGSKASYYHVEIAVSDPRQGDVWWRGIWRGRFKVEALKAARAAAAGSGSTAVRVVEINEECVWANNAARVQSGAPVITTPKTKRRSRIKRLA